MIISRVLNQKLSLPVMQDGPGTGPDRFPTDPWAPDPSFQHNTQCYYSVTSNDMRQTHTHTHTHTHTYPHSCTPLTVFPGEMDSSQEDLAWSWTCDLASDICSVRCGEFTCNNFFLIRAANIRSARCDAAERSGTETATPRGRNTNNPKPNSTESCTPFIKRGRDLRKANLINK